jgi:Flp pilus assembly protein TadG
MKSLKKTFKKNEKGQVLVILALTIVGLIAIMGLAIDTGYMYVSYARLRRSVDSAALSATSQFKRGAVAQDISNAARQFLTLNNQTTTNVKIESCFFVYDESLAPADRMTVTPVNNEYPWGGSGDASLCPIDADDTPRKLIRVTATEDVPTFFLAVIGFSEVPISAFAISEAASLEMVMVIDRSESMAWFKEPDPLDPAVATQQIAYPSNSRDPKECNVGNSCHPFKEVKDAATTFINDFIYEPYDRVAIVTFDQHAKKYDPNTGFAATDNTLPVLTSKKTEMIDIIQNLTVTEGVGACHRDPGDGSYGGPDFQNGFTLDNGNWFRDGLHTWGQDDSDAPCRLYKIVADPYTDPLTGDVTTDWPILNPETRPVLSKTFYQFSCSGAQSLPADLDVTYCNTSNIGEGLYFASSIYGNTAENVRQEALWVTLLLTDGNANIGFYDDGDGVLDNPYCPDGQKGTIPGNPYCRDTNALVRHCLSANITDPLDPKYPYYCMDQQAPAKFVWPSTWTYTQEPNEIDVDNYDADDYARDMTDRLVDGAFATVFAIGLGSGVTSDIYYYDPGTPIAGHALLTYIAAKGGTDDYYQADNTELPQVFLAIANKIATRLTH